LQVVLDAREFILHVMMEDGLLQGDPLDALAKDPEKPAGYLQGSIRVIPES